MIGGWLLGGVFVVLVFWPGYFYVAKDLLALMPRLVAAKYTHWKLTRRRK